MKRMIAVLLAVPVLFSSGCISYHGERHFGNYYDTTKQIWSTRFSSHGWLPEAKSFGQTIGLSGLMFFFYGCWVTMPTGIVVHEVEKVTLAPAADTLYLPVDFLNRSRYLEWKESQRQIHVRPNTETEAPKSDTVCGAEETRSHEANERSE